ncbi:PEPxxWA-CTERM sorting domain-containing protein [Sphingomonas sp. FW199]|uniref:PEPxxWA-CTERM sorting domain-containing protein n=1 Tax=Sphingomonas sp. FW199 TaxID=3400217 RepID=UPI003CF94A02
MTIDELRTAEHRFQRNALIGFGIALLIATLVFSLARGTMSLPGDVAAAFTPAPTAADAAQPLVTGGGGTGGVIGGGVGGPAQAGRNALAGANVGTPPALGTLTTPTVPDAGALAGAPADAPPVGQGFLPADPGVGGGTTPGGGIAPGGGTPGFAGGTPGLGGGGGAGPTSETPTDPTTPTNPTTPTEPTNPTNPTTPTEPTNPTNPTDPVTPAPAVPEPMTWMMMILGVAIAGGALRRERARSGLAMGKRATA